MKTKLGITLVGLFLLLAGFMGFIASVGNSVRGQFGRFYDQVPIHELIGIVVDGSGNIFWGTSNHNSIQVYDNTGAFLYRFSFPTGGGTFSFYIDSYDILHVATARGNRVFSFKEGVLINEERCEDSSSFYEFRNRRQREYVDRDGNIYRIRPRWVRMYDEHDNFMRTIFARTPIWPFSPIIMWLIVILGIIMVLLANKVFFLDIIETMYEKRKNRSW